MDYLWAPKDEKVVSGLLDHLGIEKVGKSGRYPTGVKRSGSDSPAPYINGVAPRYSGG